MIKRRKIPHDLYMSGYDVHKYNISSLEFVVCINRNKTFHLYILYAQISILNMSVQK